MTLKLSQIAKELDIDFDGSDIEIDGISTLNQATSSNLSFINSSKYLSDLSHTSAAAVFIEEKYLESLPVGAIPLLTDNPYLKMALASKLFRYKPSTTTSRVTMGKNCDISDKANFGTNVSIGDNVIIMAGCYIGDDTTIGSDTILYANVSIYHHSIIGSDCILHSGVIIGADGYGFTPNKDGKHIKIYQNGNAVIGDNVEIGANSTVDRAAFGTTLIKSGTKIDNLVQIAHNCEIGENCLLVCQTALAGTTKLGNNVVMGGQSGSTGHLDIGDGAIIASRAGVTKSIDGGKVYGGFPIMEQKLWLRLQAKLLRIIKQ